MVGIPQTGWVTLKVLTVRLKDGGWVSDRRCSSKRSANSAIYSTFVHLAIFGIWWARAGALQDCALAVVPCTFSDLVITFRGRHKETSCFGGLKSTFCDNCRRSEWFYVDLLYRFRGRRTWQFCGRCSES